MIRTKTVKRKGFGAEKSGDYWLYGVHAVVQALRNPARPVREVVHAAEAPPAAELAAAAAARGLQPKPLQRQELDRLLPAGSVHQGAAARVARLPDLELGALLDGLGEAARSVVVVLDQVTDPQNVGAVLRSAAAFGAAACIVTERHAAPETGVLAKAASGALDAVPLVRVANLAQAMDRLKAARFWCIGLAADAGLACTQADLGGRIALILGAEGRGLRRLTRERCDLVVRLPTGGPIGHLNVSAAAAVALYEAARQSAPGACS
jgi:23S rRNA (guanosine2251-2'-O)-methyltransferase